MGYYSDVRITVSKKGCNELKKFTNKYLLEHENEEASLLNRTDIYDVDDDRVYLGWNSIKWYDYGYPLVDSIMKGLDYLADNNYSYNYARIGEDITDVDIRYNYSDTDTDLYEIEIVNASFNDPKIESVNREKQIQGIMDVILNENNTAILQGILLGLTDGQRDVICRCWHIGYDENDNPED